VVGLDSKNSQEQEKKPAQNTTPALKEFAPDDDDDPRNEMHEQGMEENILGFLAGKPKKKPMGRDPYADRLELARRERNAQSLYFKNLLAKFNSGEGMAAHEKRDLGRWLATQPGNLRAKHELEQYMDESGVAESDTLMNKLHQARLQEGRVKELANDFKTLTDVEFIKKYGKDKAAIRRDMKRVDEAPVNELSTNRLAQYKTAAARDAKQADQAGDVKRGDKRFGGIVKATKKQFDNDARQSDQKVRESRLSVMTNIIKGQ
jgi:hypothetical protein